MNAKRYCAAFVAALVLLCSGQAFASGQIADVQAIPSTSEAGATGAGFDIQFFIQNGLLVEDGNNVGDMIRITFPTGTDASAVVAADVTVNGSATLDGIANSIVGVGADNVLEIILGDGGGTFAATGERYNPGEIRIRISANFVNGTAGTALTVTVETLINDGSAVIDKAGPSQPFRLVTAGVELETTAFTRTSGVGTDLPLVAANYQVGFTNSVGLAIDDSLIVVFPSGTNLANLVIGDVTPTGGGLTFNALTISNNRVALYVDGAQGVAGAVTVAFGNLKIVNPIRARLWNYALIQQITPGATGTPGTIIEIGYTPALQFGNPVGPATPAQDVVVTTNPTNLIISETARHTYTFETSTAANDDQVIFRFGGGTWNIAGATLGTVTLAGGGSLQISARTDTTLTLQLTGAMGDGAQSIDLRNIIAPPTATGSAWVGIRMVSSGGIIEGESRVFMSVYNKPAVTFTTPAPTATANTTGAGGSFILQYSLSDPVGPLGAQAQIYRFYVSQNPNLNLFVQGGGAARAFKHINGDPSNAIVAGANATRDTINTSTLPEGTWYVYAVAAGAGDVSRGRSGAIVVTHPPVVNSVGPAVADTLDSGDPNFQDHAVIQFDIVDYDDNADVRIFYAVNNGNLTVANVTTSGTSPNIEITGLTGATLLANADSLKSDDNTSILWRIFMSEDSTFIAKGNYTIYAVATDGKTVAFGQSAGVFTVQHSPDINLSAPTAGVEFNSGTNQVMMIAWHGPDGAKDIDDNADISLYYAYDADLGGTPFNAGKGDVAAFLTALADGDVIMIVEGLKEEEHDQYVWDLQSFSQSPAINGDVSIYALIDDGQSQVLDVVESIIWVNASFFQFTGPISQGITVDRGTKVKIPFKLRDLQTTKDQFILVASTLDPNASPAHVIGDFNVDATINTWIINTDASAAGPTSASSSLKIRIAYL